MNPEQQRIAIAEACGWTDISDKIPSPGGVGWAYGRMRGVNPKGYRVSVPDYLNDLNAMHEAWLKLSPSQKERFESELYSIVIGKAEYNRNDDAGWITNATAAQRADAFLKTLNLWNE